MLAKSLISGLFLVTIGFLLYQSMLYILELGSKIRLRKRKYNSKSRYQNNKIIVMVSYILGLISMTVMGFLAIRFFS